MINEANKNKSRILNLQMVVTSSATRFGEILPLWQIFSTLWAIFYKFYVVFYKDSPFWQKILLGIFSVFCKWPNIEK